MNYVEYLASPAWETIRKQALERDSYRCRLCDISAEDVRLNVHHRRYPPEAKWHLDTLDAVTTLCEPCHGTHTERQRLAKTPAKQNGITVGEAISMRQHPIYGANPSVPLPGVIDKRRRLAGGIGCPEWEEVDDERFVKLFLAGLKQATGLSKPGMAVFELVYNALRDTPKADTVQLSVLTAGMKKTTYYEGLRDLLKREFLFRSPYEGTFFVNIRFMFNGDRLAFVRAFHRSGSDQLARLSK